MPSYDGRIQGRSRPKGLPEVGQFLSSSTNQGREVMITGRQEINTPYRLPKLHSSDQSRAGSVTSFIDPPKVGKETQQSQQRATAEVLRMSGSPLKVPLKSSFDYPRLTHAIIAPKAAVTFTRSGEPRVHTRSGRRSEMNAYSRQTVRPQTALSDTGSIHWALGTSKSVHFDKKGRSRHQGPFSREFKRTCMAPSNWMRMKYNTVLY